MFYDKLRQNDTGKFRYRFTFLHEALSHKSTSYQIEFVVFLQVDKKPGYHHQVIHCVT